MHSLLLKVPLLLVVAYCAHICAKPPNPPATSEEQTRYAKDHGIQDPVTTSFLWSAQTFRRSTYLIVFVETCLILSSAIAPPPFIPQIFHPFSPLDTRNIRLSNIFLLGILFMCTGTAIRAACYRHLGRLFTFELSVKKGHRLVTDGPYAVVRHPSYVGSVFFYLGSWCTQLGPGSVLAASGLWSTPAGWTFALLYLMYGTYVCSFLIARVPQEDLVMKQQFGSEWTAWAEHTPYRLIPYIY